MGRALCHRVAAGTRDFAWITLDVMGSWQRFIFFTLCACDWLKCVKKAVEINPGIYFNDASTHFNKP